MSLHVSPARSEEQAAALHVFFQHIAAEDRPTRVQRALELIVREELPPDGFLACRRGTRVVGAIAALPLPGAAGLLWSPQVLCGADQKAIEDSLVQSALAWLCQRGCKFVQGLLDVSDTSSSLPLERHGFSNITTLIYLEKSLAGSSYSTRLIQQLDCQTFADCCADDLKKAFQATLVASYEDALDCPELNAMRSIEEVMEGYRAAPGCRLDRWWLAWHNKLPAGVLITTAAPESATWELLYLGLVPAARRRGFGTELTNKAMAEARAAGATRLTLTVDERNQPARRLYDSLGFVEYERRAVYLKALQ